MDKIKIKYLCMSFMVSFAMTSCDDIVTYDDNYDDGMTSTGAPVINAIYDSEDTEYTTPLESAVFEQMLVIAGNNLAQVKKIMFNDVEVQFIVTVRHILPKHIVIGDCIMLVAGNGNIGVADP